MKNSSFTSDMNGFVHILLGYGLFAGLHSKPSI